MIAARKKKLRQERNASKLFPFRNASHPQASRNLSEESLTGRIARLTIGPLNQSRLYQRVRTCMCIYFYLKFASRRRDDRTSALAAVFRNNSAVLRPVRNSQVTKPPVAVLRHNTLRNWRQMGSANGL